MPIYDKPMIYYPLSTLMSAGIREILVITTPEYSNQFMSLLGDGSSIGINLNYAVQENPSGLAEAFIIGEKFIGEESVALILGDNIFHGENLKQMSDDFDHHGGALIFAYQVSDPERYGVVEFNKEGVAVTIEEKPTNPKSNYAVPGLYFYDNNVVELAKKVTPSERGELEISSINNSYLESGKLRVSQLEAGTVWLDTGTIESMIQASEYVRVIETRQGSKIGCIEEIAWDLGWISDMELSELAKEMVKSSYGQYLEMLTKRV